MKRFIFLYTTLGKKKDAQRIAKILLQKHLIACANIFPIDSHYRWQGKIQHEKEYGMILKTVARNYRSIEKELKKIHPYDCPCLVAFELKGGYKPYLDWINDSIK
jgi:periplasmic divalent cation tolerance protein